MLTTKGSALVAGAQSAGAAALVTIRVLRSFMFQREATVVGSEIEVPVAVAAEVISSNKAERVKTSAQPASSTPADAAGAAAPAAPAGRRVPRQ
jgi:hypothetical protein